MDTKQVEKEIQELADYICQREGIEKVTIHLKDLRRCGRAHFRTNSISIPIWTLKHSVEYTWAYTIHEVCHFITYPKYNYNGHGDIFRSQEQKWLKEFGLYPERYAKAYFKELKSAAGQVFYKRSW